MARPREPIRLIEAKGKTNLTKAQIAERLATEVAPATDEIEAPRHLSAAQKKHFDKLANQLLKIKIMGETDCDTLARYVVAESQYQAATVRLRSIMQTSDDLDLMEQAAKLQDRFFKQASALARDLGLTISSRCRLIAPVKDEETKQNKFARFGGDKVAGGE